MHLNPANTGDEQPVLDLGQAAVEAHHRAVVGVVIDSSATVGVLQLVGLTDGRARGGIEGLSEQRYRLRLRGPDQ